MRIYYIQDADRNGVGDSIREVWQMDKQRMKDEFTCDQQKNCKSSAISRYMRL